MSIDAKTSSRLKKTLSYVEPKVVWHTIDSMSNSAPEWSIVVSIIIFFMAGLFAMIGFSGSSGTNLILFISALLILGGGLLIWGVRNVGKSYANMRLYAKIRKSMPLPDSFRNGKIKGYSDFENLIKNILKIFTSLILVISGFHFLQPWKYPIITAILIIVYMCVVLLTLGNEKYIKALKTIPLSRELYMLTISIIHSFKYLIATWYERYLRIEIGSQYLHPGDRTYLIGNLPRVFNPSRIMISMTCQENLSATHMNNNSKVIFHKELKDVDIRDNPLMYHFQQIIDLKIPKNAISSFKSDNNEVDWLISYKLYFKYIHWVEWRIPLIVVSTNISNDILYS